METIHKPLFGPSPSWLAAHRSEPHGFGSEAGLRHFFNKYRERLVRDRAVELLRGRWHAVEPTFTSTRLLIAAEESARAVGISPEELSV